MSPIKFFVTCCVLALTWVVEPAVAQSRDKIFENLLALDNAYSFPYTGKLILSQNIPNPFSPTDTSIIYYRVANGAQASIIIYHPDTRKPLLQFNHLPTGNGQVIIGQGQLSPGEYIYVLIVNGRQVKRRVLVVACSPC